MNNNPVKDQTSVGPRRGKFISTFRGIGITGALLSALAIGVAATFLFYFERFTISYFIQFIRLHSFPQRTSAVFLNVVAIILWLPLVPVAFAAIFLPVRIAWVKGQVTLASFVDGFVDALQRAISTLKATARQLFLLALPFIAISSLAHQVRISVADPQLIQFLAILAILFFAFIIWQGAALICAAPIAILSQCSADAAATECKLVILSGCRLQIFALVLCLGACAFGANYVGRQLLWERWEMAACWAALAILAWVIGIIIGVVCIDASVQYLERQVIRSRNAATTAHPHG